MNARILFLLVVLLLAAAPARADEIVVAAASDLKFPLEEIANRYEKRTGTSVKLIFGSSGNFFSQLENGAPFDVFLSADEEYPQKLMADGLAEAGSLRRYARGSIVVWVPARSPIDIRHLGRSALDLPPDQLRKLAIANPTHAPYGRAAVAALRYFGVYDVLKDRLVLGENISQAAQFAASGNVDMGIIALSLALSPPMKDAGDFWQIPQAAYPPIEQAAVILKSSLRKAAAAAFLKALNDADGIAILRRYGFARPHETP